MFINTGAIAAADNEAQLAGVMGHEMSHVILRHGTNQASKARMFEIPAVLAGAVVGNGSVLGQLTQLGIGLGVNSVLLSYSRGAESEADALGSRLMSEAGYNPIELAHFFVIKEPRRAVLKTRVHRFIGPKVQQADAQGAHHIVQVINTGNFCIMR